MSFAIEHFSVSNQHIKLNSDGAIVIFINHKEYFIDYKQASILKAMILAEHELSKSEK